MTRTQLCSYAFIVLLTLMFTNMGFAQTLPDFSVQISNLRIVQPQQGFPRDPYSMDIRVNTAITGTNLTTSDTRIFVFRAYLSTDNTLSADDIGLGRQDLTQNNLGLNLNSEFLINVKPKQTGTNYLLYKIDADNQIPESNENNNVSNALSFAAYTLSCGSNGLAPWNEWISNVKLNTINNTSDKTRYNNVSPVVTGYSNFLDISTTLNKGQSYPLSITPSLGYPTYPTNLFTRVWIDYNQNGVFEDAEIVLAKNGNQIATQNITVPTTALVGTTVLRVSMKAGAYPTACEAFDKGEVEDYTVNISGSVVTALPDLTFDGIFIPTSLSTTQVGDCTFRIKNIGTAASTPTIVKVFLSTDNQISNDDVQVGSQPVGALGVNGVSNFSNSLILPSTWTSNIAYVIIQIVPLRNEANTNNNVVTSLATTVLPNNACRYQDSLQLVSLYNATNGANWTVKWNLATPINTWRGITLNANGCVKGIDLNVNNLVGTLPNLSMSKLNQLFLGGNTLTGNIPNFTLPDLNILNLNYNLLSGTVPNFNLPTLQNLDLGNNQLTGTIPNFSGLPIIANIAIDNNKLSGLVPNFNLPLLNSLTLSNNQLTGTIPNLSLPQLNTLNLSTNLLTGSLPNFNLPLATGIFLSSNKLSGCIPESFRAFCGKFVNFSGNPSLATQDFASFCTISSGACVVVNNSCRYQDSLQLLSIYNATNGATWINKWNLATPINTWYGVFLNATGCLDSLNLNNNNLVGTIPTISAANLRSLQLVNNKLSGGIPTINAPNLEELFLLLNQLNGAIPNFNLPKLKSINLSNNQLSGTIPNFILPNLEKLIIESNPLNSALPNFNLPKLKILILQNDKLTGTIPSFNLLTNLEQLIMPANLLTGSIPNFNLPNLTGIGLGGNQLSGAIPNLNLPKLTTLYISSNKLTGSIPDFASLPLLTTLLLDNNSLSGCLPIGLKAICSRTGNSVNISNNLSLANQNFATFCSNNIGSCNAPLPDFRMTAITQAQGSDLTTTTYRPRVDGFGINYVLTNDGGAYTSPATAFFYLSKDTILDSRDSFFTKLLAGATGTYLAGGTVPNLADGDYFLIGKANGDNAIPESNVNNNTFVLQTPKVKIRNVVANDIVIGMAAVPSVYNQFEGHLFKVTASNLRTTAYTNVKVQFIFPAKTTSGGTATPTTGVWQEYCPGGTRCYTWTIPILAAGATATLDVPLYILDATGLIVAKSTLLSSTPIAVSNIGTTTLTPVTPSVAPASQALAFQVPTQLVPVVIQAISPNPTEGDVQVKLDSWTKQDVNFNFSDITGKTIHSEKRTLDKGLNRVEFDVTALPQGVYFIQTNVGKGKNVPTKFVKM